MEKHMGYGEQKWLQEAEQWISSRPELASPRLRKIWQAGLLPQSRDVYADERLATVFGSGSAADRDWRVDLRSTEEILNPSEGAVDALAAWRSCLSPNLAEQLNLRYMRRSDYRGPCLVLCLWGLQFVKRLHTGDDNE